MAGTVAADVREPPVPIGTDPGGMAVAIVSTGIDYRDGSFAGSLARDGEGQIIGWDFVDNDQRPFAEAAMPDVAQGSTALAVGRLKEVSKRASIPIRFVIGKIEPENLEMRAKALAYVARTPARIVYLPRWVPGKDGQRLLDAAAKRAGHLLVVTDAPPDSGPLRKEEVSAATTIAAGADVFEIIVRAAAMLSKVPNLSASEIKQRLAAKEFRHDAP